MKKKVIGLAVAAMILLLSLAAAWDSLRIAADGRRRVAIADEEMRKHEQRLVKLLAGSPQLSPEARAAIAKYEAADERQSRHAAYDSLVASFRQTMSGDVDPTNPLDRKFMDDIAGAINRREVAEKAYDNESQAYRQFLSGMRGDLARSLSGQARADWNSGD